MVLFRDLDYSNIRNVFLCFVIFETIILDGRFVACIITNDVDTNKFNVTYGSWAKVKVWSTANETYHGWKEYSPEMEGFIEMRKLKKVQNPVNINKKTTKRPNNVKKLSTAKLNRNITIQNSKNRTKNVQKTESPLETKQLILVPVPSKRNTQKPVNITIAKGKGPKKLYHVEKTKLKASNQTTKNIIKKM